MNIIYFLKYIELGKIGKLKYLLEFFIILKLSN